MSTEEGPPGPEGPGDAMGPAGSAGPAGPPGPEDAQAPRRTGAAPDRRPQRGTTLVLLGIMGAIFVLLRLWHESTPQAIRGGALYGPLVRHGDYFRLLSHALLHGSVAHLLVNGYALFVLGPATEQLYGRARLLGFFALCVLGGGLASVLHSDNAVAVGASGGLFGLMAVQVMVGLKLWPRLTRKGRWAFLRSLGLVVVVNGAIAVWVPNLDHAAHAGGVAVGLLLGAITPLALPWERPRQTPLQQRLYWGVAAISAAVVLWGAARVVPLQRRPWDYGWRAYAGAGVTLRAQRCFGQEVYDGALILTFPGLAVGVQVRPGKAGRLDQIIAQTQAEDGFRFEGRTDETDPAGQRWVLLRGQVPALDAQREVWLRVQGADVLAVDYERGTRVPDLLAPPLWELIRDVKPDGGAQK